MSPQSNTTVSNFNAEEYNTLARDINEIVGIGAGDSGYGQTQLFVNQISRGQKILKQHWMDLFYALTFTAAHQGTALTTPGGLLNGTFTTKLEVFTHIDSIRDDIIALRSNKMTFTLSKMTVQNNLISTMNTYVNPVDFPSATPDEIWESDVDNQWFEFRVKFSDENARRQYFNTGGEIRIDAELDSTTFNVQYIPSNEWHLLLERIGVVKFGHNSTTSSLSYGTPGVGFTGLTDTYQKVYNKVIPAQVGIKLDFYGQTFEVWARLCEDSEIDISVYFLNSIDAVAGGGYSGYGGYTDIAGEGDDVTRASNYVDGALTVSVSQQRADDAHPSQLGVNTPSPQYITLTDLTGLLTRPT